jgi:N-acetylglucosaminyldiphosphoundecaprenol N-acetyl-beta-D-mannosaminyltransferase
LRWKNGFRAWYGLIHANVLIYPFRYEWCSEGVNVSVSKISLVNMQFRFDRDKIEVTCPTWTALLLLLRRKLSERQGFALATINLDHLVKLRADTAFRNAYVQHDIVVADGNPIVWLSQLAQRPVQLIPGSDLIAPLVELAAQMDVPVAFFGSEAGILDAAAVELQSRYPKLNISLKIAPPMGFDPTGEAAQHMLAQISASGARLCFIALGAPKQERFAAFARVHAPALGLVSIGAGLDFVAGGQTRAPRIVRAVALEWLWRMLMNPRRLTMRYVRCAAILPAEAVAALRLRTASTLDQAERDLA